MKPQEAVGNDEKDCDRADTTSSDGEHTAEWLKKKTDSLREQILSKLPEDKREAWIAQGASVLEKYGLVDESREFTNSLLQKGAELLKENAELRRSRIWELLGRQGGHEHYGQPGGSGEDEGETGGAEGQRALQEGNGCLRDD